MGQDKYLKVQSICDRGVRADVQVVRLKGIITSYFLYFFSLLLITRQAAQLVYLGCKSQEYMHNSA